MRGICCFEIPHSHAFIKFFSPRPHYSECYLLSPVLEGSIFFSSGNMGKLTKEEEVLLSNYSSSTSTGNSIMFYINAAVVSLAPIYLFYGVHQMEVDSIILYLAGK